MDKSKLPHRAIALLFLTIAALCTTAAAQTTDLQPAQNSNSACASKPIPEPPHPDILSTIYTPPKPKPDAVTAPRLISSVEPHFPSDTPQGPFSGITKVALLVDTDGKPQQVHVEQSLGPSFDKKAVAAVSQYRFHPALQYGKPVQVKICVEINYRK